MRFAVFAAVLAALVQAGWAATYTFTPIPETGNAAVRVRLEGKEAKAFRMPAWAPGDYQIFNYGRFVETIEFKKDGKPAPSQKSEADPNLWILPEGADEAVYTIKPSNGNFSPNLRVTATQAFVSGPGVLGWFEGDERNKQTLLIALKPSGASAHSTLEPVAAAPSGFAQFAAPNYDELLDAPLVVGTGIRVEHFEVRGKPMSVIAYNRAESADLSGFVRVGKKVAEACHELFGELPYPRYAFFCDFGGRGGGLEHLNSTRLGLSTNSTGEGSYGLVYHEFVHAYNVKRIRPKGLGPFDYTKPLVIDTIWWLEGVTDYYASVLAVRSGMETREAFLRNLAFSFARMQQNPNSLKVSADESSRRVWETRGSFGYLISYYEKGHLIGACLDLMIRGKTLGRYSLDNVIRDLYNETKGGKPGYDEGRIRELCIKYGGPELGPYYDRCAKQAVPLPIEEAARAAGLTYSGETFLPDSSASQDARRAGSRWPLAPSVPVSSLLK
jgi:predicted metalloprotease with PDZ domain